MPFVGEVDVGGGEAFSATRRYFIAIENELRRQARFQPVDRDVKTDISEEDLRCIDYNVVSQYGKCEGE